MTFPQSRSNCSSPACSKRAAFALIACLAALVYFRAVFFGFTYLDDNALIIDDNQFLRDLKNVPRAFVQEVFHTHNASAAYYRPVLTLSLMMDAQFGKAEPLLYHLSNIIFHILASWLAFLLLIELGAGAAAALGLSCIFAVHPLLSQAVAWIPGRNDSLLAVFAFSAMITFIRFMARGDYRYAIGHCGLFGLGLFTKESMILLVFLAALWRALHPHAGPRSKLAWLLVAWAVPIAIWLGLRHIALVNPIRYGRADIVHGLIANAPGILLDMGKSLFPVNLSVLPILKDSTLLYGIVAASLFVLLAVISFFKISALSAGDKTEARASAGTFLFGLAWFLAFLLPSFIRPNARYPADFIEHRMYAPFFGLILCFSQFWFLRRLVSPTPAACAGFGACVMVFALTTEIHIDAFGDRTLFWKNAVINSFHHPLAHKNLGAMYHLDGNLDAAEKEYRVALDLYPYETMVHNNLGLIYKNRKEFDKARNEFMEELRFNPTYDDAYYNWGLMCYQRGQKEEAKKLWLKTLECNPRHYQAQNALRLLATETGVLFVK